MRLDKYLADCELGTRAEVKKIIQKARVQINDTIVTNPAMQVKESDIVLVDQQEINYQQYIYYLFHKPMQCVCAAKDNLHQTVFDYVPMNQKKDLFTVGRLDVDTEGLVLITNDGELSHRLLSPKRHVDKKYYAKVDGRLTEEDVEAFAKGIDIHEKNLTKPGTLEIISADVVSEAYVTICEGKFHQVKRMFLACGKEVTYLKRITMGVFTLDDNLAPGEYRTLNEREMEYVREYKSGHL